MNYKLFPQRFWEKVDDLNGLVPEHCPELGKCWEWEAAKFPSGHGSFLYKSGYTSAHRTSWFIHFGEIPPGMCVCHRCDNPGCVNPDHLFLGTRGDNNRDCDEKGRRKYARGEAVGGAVLTATAVLEIRRRRAEGEKLVPLAKEFGVKHQTIVRLVRRKTWKHLAEIIVLIGLFSLKSEGKTLPFDPYSVTRIEYNPKNCKRVDDKRMCTHVIVSFGALRVPSKPHVDDSGAIRAEPGVSTFVPPATAYTGTVRFTYYPERCKPLNDKYDRYVCGSPKGQYSVFWTIGTAENK